MDKQIFRIGLSGPSGSGKTTLAKWLSEELKIPFLPNSASITLSERNRDYLSKTFGYENKGHANVIKMSNENPEFGIAFQESLLEARLELLEAEVSKGNNFITDRTLIDNAVYFLTQCGPHTTSDKCDQVIRVCSKNLHRLYTHLFIVKPNESWTEDNGSRVANHLWQNLAIWPVFREVSIRLETTVSPIRPLDVWDWDTRQDRILKTLGLK